MPKSRFASASGLLGCVLVAVSVVHAQRSAVITQDMPPGGEGPASVALGVAVPGGLPSMEVNPALLAWEGARTNSTLQFSTSHSELLPELTAKWSPKDKLKEDVRSIGLTIPIKAGTNVALGYSWHRVDFGQNQLVMPDDHIQTFQSDEAVHHVVASARLGGIASVGAGWRWIDSRLAPGLKDSAGNDIGTGTASTWDLGVLVAPRWRIPGTPVRVGPSVGMSWITLGEDSIWYGDKRYKDPVYRMRRWGASASLKAPDFVALDLFLDEEVDLGDETRREAIEYQGWSVEALGLMRWSSADLVDPSGKRYETQTSTEYIVDLKQLWRLWTRVKTGNYLEDLDGVPEGYPLPSWTVLGATITPNLRVVYTRSMIESERSQRSDGVREGQKRIAWALAL